MSSGDFDTRTKILRATWELMEKSGGKNVHMSHIAKAVGISRQAVYLHFTSRNDLMIATMEYVDEVKGLNGRLEQLHTVSDSIELLQKSIEIWGNYIPEIYGLAKGLLSSRDSDEAAAAAWNNSMQCLADACRIAIQALKDEDVLAGQWSVDEGVEMLFTMLSIQSWEQLTIEFGWPQPKYLEHISKVAQNTFVAQSTMASE